MPGKPNTKTKDRYVSPAQIRERGDRALERAIASTQKRNPGQKTIASDFLYDEVLKMEDAGWSHRMIAVALKRAERYIDMVIARNRDQTIRRVVVKSNYDESDERFKFTDWDIEAFILFFNTFSGLTFPPHARPWVEAFLSERNLILNVPPRHAKSTIFAVWIPIWLICRDRNVQIIIVSAANDLATQWALEIAGQLELNEDLIETFGRFTPDFKGEHPWKPNQGMIVVAGRTKHIKGAQYTLQSKGMTQRILGQEADFVIVDDATTPEVASNEKSRVVAMNHLLHQVLTRIQPQVGTVGGNAGRAIVIGQRVHNLDFYGELAQMFYERGELKGQPVWHVEKYPAVLKWPDENEGVAEVLWPEWLSYEELMVQYARVGGEGPFSTMFQQEPLAEDSTLIRKSWFDACKDRARNGYEGVRMSRGDPNWVRVCSVDPSPDNFHGIIVADVLVSKTDFRCVIIEVQQMRSGLRDLVNEVHRIQQTYAIDEFVFEQTTFAKWFFEDPLYISFKDKFHTTVHKTSVNKNDALYGIQSLAFDFEAGFISMPYADADGRRMTDLFAREALGYPFYTTDDMMMALWFIKYNYRRIRPRGYILEGYKQTSSKAGWSWWRDLKQQEPIREAYRKRRAS
jgi:hypothetical protein